MRTIPRDSRTSPGCTEFSRLRPHYVEVGDASITKRYWLSTLSYMSSYDLYVSWKRDNWKQHLDKLFPGKCGLCPPSKAERSDLSNSVELRTAEMKMNNFTTAAKRTFRMINRNVTPKAKRFTQIIGISITILMTLIIVCGSMVPALTRARIIKERVTSEINQALLPVR